MEEISQSRKRLAVVAARVNLLASAPDDALVSIREGEYFLNRSHASIYRDISAGRIQAVKIGGSRRLILGSLRQLAKGA